MFELSLVNLACTALTFAGISVGYYFMSCANKKKCPFSGRCVSDSSSCPGSKTMTLGCATTNDSKAESCLTPLRGNLLSPPAVSYRQFPTGMKGFLQVMDMLADEIVDLEEVKELPAEGVEWLRRMTEYNVKGGKMNRGVGVVDVVKSFVEARQETMDNNLFVQASILGCCIEWLQAFFLVADDVMDDSVTRRGKPCWFRNNDVKLIAINDAFILESYVFKILERHFSHLPIYVHLVDLFHQVTFKTEMGQLLDLTSQPLDKPVDLNRFTLERYRLIVKYKTAYYTFYLSVAIGMIVSGFSDKRSLKIAEKICLMMGEYFQIQDDFLDCFGNPEHIGKIGTDIQDNKCSWLVVQALACANPEQRELLTANYGKHDEKSVQIVKNLYREMNLPGIFQRYEDESYAEINAQIDLVPELPRQVFDSMLQKIYKRSK